MGIQAAELFGLLVAIFLVDCFRWVARGAVLFRLHPFGVVSASGPWQVAGQFRRALAFGSPIPLLGSLLETEQLQLRPGPCGVRVASWHERGWTLPGADDVAVTWSDAVALEVRGLELWLRGNVIAAFGSRRMAGAVSQMLAQWAGAPEAKRLSAIEASLANRFDSAAAKARLMRWRPWRWALAAPVTGLQTVLFGGLALAAFSERSIWLAGVVILGVALWSMALVLAVTALRRLLPEGARPSIGQRALLFLSPLSLMRASDLIESELVSDFEPAAVAVALGAKPLAGALVRQALRELEFPLRPALPAPAMAGFEGDDVWLRQRLKEALRRLADAAQLQVADPTPAAAFYCPRCLTGYVVQASECASCPGVRVIESKPTAPIS